MKDGLYWAQELRQKKISHQELISEIQQKIQKINPELNALIAFYPQAALNYLEKNPNVLELPFAGQPLPLKILGQNHLDWPATSASQLLKKSRASRDDFFVQQLKASGFVPIGQTNSPEFGFKNITDPKLYGVTRNPWNLEKTPGGSSGGAAASVASGIFPIAGASDGGGSIRIPAAFCGLIGLKPTRGTIPVGPDHWRGWQGAAINFALTISMRDTKELYYQMRKIHPAAPYQAPFKAWQDSQTSVSKKLRIAVCLDSPVQSAVSKEAQEAVIQAQQALEKLGHSVVEVSYPVDGRQLIHSYYEMNGAETAAMMATIEQHHQRAVTLDDVEPMTWAIYQYGKKIPAANYVYALQLWDEATYQMEELFTDYDLFLSPTTAQVAPDIATEFQSEALKSQLRQIQSADLSASNQLIQDMFQKGLEITPFTQLANLTGQPAISLPTHLTAENLPLGIQFMAARGREDLLFLVGEIFEQAVGFHLPPSYQ
ncbi:MAG: amidase [Enterococcus sp.]